MHKLSLSDTTKVKLFTKNGAENAAVNTSTGRVSLALHNDVPGQAFRFDGYSSCCRVVFLGEGEALDF